MGGSKHLVSSVREELDGLLPLYPLCSIYKVPERLRRVSQKAYAPKVVSIGPLHHGKEHLKPMEEHKMRYLQQYLRRTQINLEDYIRKIREQEAGLRSCYAETIAFSSDEFVRIILVDVAFLIEVLLRFRFRQLSEENDRLFNRPWMFEDLWMDLLLLENQLPFFILEDCFDADIMQRSSNLSERLSLIDLSHFFFTNKIQIKETEGNLEIIRSSQVAHLVDFCRSIYLPLKPSATRGPAPKTTPRITELNRAGVKFKLGSSSDLFNIQFSSGVLEIPKLAISDQLEITIKNLIALEQTDCMETIVSDYAFIINRLVKTSKDVELLVSNEILENGLGSISAAAAVINNLADGLTVDPEDCCYGTILKDLNEHCSKPWHQWREYLRKHLLHSWATKKTIGAVVLLVLIFIQTICLLIFIGLLG
ncbi:UPF0481 protein At3g47200-like [Argentina anserina]|uniref:UPF0481 protein At3g47200-like n=1 Tax=Argentina anserina TaxID=57926 RepID=UPI0021768743|nr:UPF0481 protein At3g47200-like [Potentilla anserina]